MADISGFTEEVLVEPTSPLAGLEAVNPLAGFVEDAPLVPTLTELPPGVPAGFTQEVAPLDLVPTPDGPAITPAGFTEAIPVPEPSLVQDDVASSSSTGAILDAFLQGAEDGWGIGRLGLSPESEAKLGRAGIFKDVNDAGIQPLRALNMVIIRPLAASIDLLLRTGNAAIVGVASAVGALAEETGLAGAVGLPSERLVRDLIALTDVVGIVLGTAAARPPTVRSTKPVYNMRKADSAPTRATKPFKNLDDTLPDPTHDVKPRLREDSAGNINLNKIDAGEDVKDVIRAAALVSDDFLVQRRGVVSWEQTGELADALGMTPQQLSKTKIGTAFNAHELDASIKLLINSADDVRNMAFTAERGTALDMLNLEESVLRHLAIQESVSGTVAEAGRALNSLKKKRASTLDADEIGRLLEGAGGRDGIQELISKLKEFNSPQQLSKYLAESRKATSGDMLVEAWINALLSGPQTHVTNIVSNTIVATVMTIPESFVSAGVSTLKGAKGTDKIFFGEASQRLYGFAQGGLDGLRVGWRSFKNEEASSIHTKVEQPRQKAIPSKTLFITKKHKFVVGGKTFTIGGKFEVGGRQVRIPGRALIAMDEFFKAIGYRQELNAQAYRIGASEGLSGNALAGRIAELIENPTPAMQKLATATAEYQTFTKPLGKAGQAVQKISNSHPVMKIPFTFVRTPVNIMKYAGERTVLSLLSKKVRGRLFGKEGSVAQSEQMARLIIGSSVAVGAWVLASEGFITGGGPADPRVRALKYNSGWQPYSLRIGEMYYSFARGEPVGTIVGAIADLYEIREAASDPEITDLTAMIAAAIAKNVLSKTWTRGASDLVEAVSDPDRYGDRYILKLLGTVVPTGLAQAARVQDPFLREARTVLDMIKSRVPGLSETLFPRRDLWGEPIMLEGSLGPDLFSPIYESRLKKDPVNIELLKLQIYPAALQRKIRGVDLSDAQFEEFQVIAGKPLKLQLDAMVRIPGWYTLSAFTRIGFIKIAIDKNRDNARTAMTMRYPQLFKDIQDVQHEHYGLEPLSRGK